MTASAQKDATVIYIKLEISRGPLMKASGGRQMGESRAHPAVRQNLRKFIIQRFSSLSPPYSIINGVHGLGAIGPREGKENGITEPRQGHSILEQK